MAQLDFYAVRSDIELLLSFIFDQIDCQVFEAYSRPGHRLREFPDREALLGSDHLSANHGRYFLRLLPKGIGSEPIISEFTLTKTGQSRWMVDSPAIFQISQGHTLDTQDDALYWSTFSHWNEAGAKQRSYHSDELLDAVDWAGMRRISGKIQRCIKRLAVARVRTRPILPGAFEAMGSSLVLWRGPGLVDRTSSEIEVY